MLTIAIIGLCILTVFWLWLIYDFKNTDYVPLEEDEVSKVLMEE